MKMPMTRRSLLKTASISAGGFLVTSQAQDPPPLLPDTGRFRVVCYNVHNYRLTPFFDPLTNKTSAVKSPEERNNMAKLLARLKPDVLAMTEIGEDAALQDLQKNLAAQGWTMEHREMLVGRDEARRLAILSRLPITSRQHLPNPRFLMDTMQREMSRGIFDVTLHASTKLQFRLIGVHLKSQREMSDANQAMVRRNEGAMLRKRLDELLTTDRRMPILVFGDFNDTKDSPTLRAVLRTEDDDLRLHALDLSDSSGDRWTYHYDPSDEYSRIDFLLASNAMLPMLDVDESGIYSGKDWMLASDHRPLYATFRPHRANEENFGKQPKARR